MRVFELARELNIPGKDLIERMKALGYKVEGNFNQLDDQTVAEVKSKMLEPVTRVEEEAPKSDEELSEEEAQPRKRRIISARRSGEARKIQKSLGMEGPLPEDLKTREEVQPGAVEGEDAPALEEAPELAAGLPAEAGEAPAHETEAQPPVEAEALPEETEPPQPEGPRPIVGIPLPKPVDVDKAKSPRKEPEEEWRDVKRAGERKREDTRGGGWRDMKRPRRGGGDWTAPSDDEWVRPRRSGDRRGKRVARGGAAAEARHTFNPRQKAIRIGDTIRVSEFAGAIGVKAPEIIKKLMSLGTMATVNDSIESATAELIAAEYNLELEVAAVNVEELIREEAIDEGELESRPPIVTIMGHVDHGKTTLLDYIRSSRITSGEAGGITQHIGAYYVRSEMGDTVFLDTPGHEAFTTLRQRGADVTDLVVLIVAADDGVMPQTVEAIDHAKAAEVPILVAVNKIDRPNADLEKVKRQLMEHSLVPEEFGGDTLMVPISAKTGEGVSNLLEMIHLQAELLELKSTPKGKARGHIIEAEMDRRRGPVATMVIERGTLRVGDFFVVGETSGRVRAMGDDQGRPLEEATPSMPIEILGFDDVPAAGDLFAVMEDEKVAREVAQSRAERKREEESEERRRVNLENFLTQVGEGEETAVLNIVLKADTQGSLEALRASLEKEGDQRVRVSLIRAGVGGITETDVTLAATSEAVVIGFNVRPETKASELGRNEGVEVKTYTVIYELIDDIHAALLGMLKPVMREEVIGHLEVLDVFNATKEGRIAGGTITDGRMESNCAVRVYRDDVLIHSGSLNSLRRFKDDVATVQSGQECGFRIANFSDLRTGDLVEAYTRIEEAPTLERSGRA